MQKADYLGNDKREGKCNRSPPGTTSGGSLKGLEALEVGVPGRPAETETHGASLADSVNETCFREFPQVMGDGGGGDGFMLVKRATLQMVALSDLLKDGKASRVGECTGNGGDLLGGEVRVACHAFIVRMECWIYGDRYRSEKRARCG